MRKTWVLANPHSGTAEMGEALAQRAAQLDAAWIVCEGPSEAMRLARDAANRGVELLIAAGGDGTVHTVVQGMMESPHRPVLGILPLGTGNDLARSLQMPLEPIEALETVLRASRVRRIDIARVTLDGVRRWLVNASAAGFAGEVDRRVDEAGKKRWGPLAYWRGAIGVIRDLPAYDVSVAIDGQVVDQIRVVGLAIANARTCGGGVQVAPTADLEDGLLDATFVEADSRVGLASVGAALTAGRIYSETGASHQMGSRIQLGCSPPMPFNVDGELIGDVSVAEYVVVPQALALVVGDDYRREAGREFGNWTSMPG